MASPGFLIALLSIVAFSALAQSGSDTKARSTDSKLPSSLEGSKPAAFRNPGKKQKEDGKITYKARGKYERRLERLKKRSKKKELAAVREASHEWKRPDNFGHKRTPRKRPASKQKYCKVCGINH